MIKIPKDRPNRLYLRPNCLLTRKPVLVVSSTSQSRWWQRFLSWPKRRLYLWQISRHGYLTTWPVPPDLILKKNPAFHYLDVDQIKYVNCIDFLILCAENDYLES